MNNVTSFYESVCASLGAPIGTIEPEIINLPMHTGAALQELNAKFPGIDEIDADDPRRLDADRAIIAATALKLLPYWVLNYTKIEQLPGSKIELFEPDWDALTEQLQGEIDTALGNLDPALAESGYSFYGIRRTFGNEGRRSL